MGSPEALESECRKRLQFGGRILTEAIRSAREQDWSRTADLLLKAEMNVHLARMAAVGRRTT